MAQADRSDLGIVTEADPVGCVNEGQRAVMADEDDGGVPREGELRVERGVD